MHGIEYPPPPPVALADMWRGTLSLGLYTSSPLLVGRGGRMTAQEGYACGRQTSPKSEMYAQLLHIT